MFYLCHDINQVYVSKWQFEFKMKKYLIILITIFVPLLMHAQSFKGYYYNDEDYISPDNPKEVYEPWDKWLVSPFAD